MSCYFIEAEKVQILLNRELTELADLNRGTFYLLHYKDVFDLLEKTESELFFKILLTNGHET